MFRPFFTVCAILVTCASFAQQRSVAVGIYTGFTIPAAIDKGIDSDPRYDARYTVKGAPFGFSLSKDFNGFGLLLMPGLVTIGQNYNVVNTEGGHVGKREFNLRYMTVPFSVKVHLIDLDFFRVSALAGITGGYLVGADNRISHSQARLIFPEQTLPFLPDGYTVEYDGVAAPALTNTNIGDKTNFESVQLFLTGGLRSDWDISDHWRVSIDVRANYGLSESRSTAYLTEINGFKSIYDSPGSRKELYAQFTIGIARFIEFDQQDRDREKKLKGTRKVFVPQKAQKPKRRTKR